MNQEKKSEFSYRKEFDEQYSNIISYLKDTDIIDVDEYSNKLSLKRNNIENLRDIIHILLVLELKRDKNINSNQKKIDLINNIGKILTSEEKNLHKAIRNVLSKQDSENLEDPTEFLENINYFLDDERFKNIPNTFQGVDRSIENTKQESRRHKYTIKKEDGFLNIYTEYFFDENHSHFPEGMAMPWHFRNTIQIKKILKPGLDEDKDFSHSKYVNLHDAKSLSSYGTNFLSEIYHSEISKILFPENPYKVRKFGDKNSVVFKLNESLRNIKKDDNISSLNIDKQSMFDSMGLALFLNLDDRSWRNYMIDEKNNKMLNIDFEIFIESRSRESLTINNFKDFLEMSKDIESNKDEIMRILLDHIYLFARDLDGEEEKTKELYENFFNNLTQDEIDQYRENFLQRFTKENIEQIKEINELYVKTLKEERPTSKDPQNKALSKNIQYIDSLMFESQIVGKGSAENSI